MRSYDRLAVSIEPSLEELYEDAPCGYLSMAPDGTILKINRTLLRSTGHVSDDLVGQRRLQDVMAPGSRIYHDTRWRQLLELEGEVREIPVDLIRADGSRLSVLLNAVMRRGSAGEPSSIRASLFDATDRRRYERDLVTARDVERAMREQSDRLVVELEKRSSQQAVVARLGTRALEGVALGVLFDECAAAVSETIRADHVVVVETGGEEAPCDAACESLRVPIGTSSHPFGTLLITAKAARSFTAGDADFAEAVAGVLGNAIERRRSEEATEHRALHDPLTGLPNRLLFDERLTREVVRARRNGSMFALCLLDLDHFKLINDNLGYAAGDSLLRAVGDRLRSAVREIDSVGRLGGDEFVVLSAEVNPDGGAQALAERLAAVLQTPFSLDGTDRVVRASIGVAEGGADSLPDELLRNADIAMYHAKERGRGQYAHFDRSMRERSHRRMRTEAELRVALEEGQLRVFYQPVVATTGRRIVSMEALVRWQHPERGLVPPGDFIPVAEESGLVVDLGRFVLTEACRQLTAWRNEGIVAADVSVAVNVSARQLTRPHFVSDVAEVLAESGLAGTPHLLGLEITETLVMDSTESPLDTLAELAALGVNLLLDDFGTGASSLARLKRFPVDTLKIDRAFIAGLGEGDGEDDAIVAAIIAMAGKLGLRVVAEGVETPEQLTLLGELGCERIQGFLFSPPLPGTDMRSLILATDGADATSAHVPVTPSPSAVGSQSQRARRLAHRRQAASPAAEVAAPTA